MTWDQMTPEQRQRMLRLMYTHGGDFVSALSTAWQHADTHNAARLAAAFPELADRYYRIWSAQEATK